MDHPEKLIEVWVERCAQCGTGLLDQAPERMIRRQVTELPEIKPVVIETRQYEVRCPVASGCNAVHGPKVWKHLVSSARAWKRWSPICITNTIWALNGGAG